MKTKVHSFISKSEHCKNRVEKFFRQGANITHKRPPKICGHSATSLNRSGLLILGDCLFIAYLKPVGLVVKVALWIVVFILHMLHNNKNQEARAQFFLAFKDHRHRFRRIDSLRESVPSWKYRIRF